ncbi:MAG: dsDNA nuclease domain-containing protein [Chloroflexota bacterium]
MSNQIQKHQSTPNLENIRQEDDGGAINISGIDYQFHFAAEKCLEMLAKPEEYEFVSSETHEDVVVKRKNGTYEFYQVKQKSSEYWTLSDLKSRGIWTNFIKVRGKFGEDNTFWFVSDQTAKYSSMRGKKREPNLGRMKTLTHMGKNICYQNEKERSDAEKLFEKLRLDWEFSNLDETENFFWNIRIVTDYLHERGLESSNTLALQELLEMRGISIDSINLRRIYNSITQLLRERVKAPDTATYEQAIEMRKIRLQDLEKCVVGPFREPNLNQFDLNDENEESQIRDLRQKTEDLNTNFAKYFIESRNYFSYLYRQQISFAALYIAELRYAVWGICHRGKVFSSDDRKPIQTYKKIINGLEDLATREQLKQPPIDVTSDYLHGMMCQLTAECHHDWYPLD